MINPYAATFMIAARQDHKFTPRPTQMPKDTSRRPLFGLFVRMQDLDPENL